LIEPAPAEDQPHVAEFRQPLNESGHEFLVKPFEIAAETESRGFGRIGFRDHDLIAGRRSPMDTTGIDHDRKLVGPRPRQSAAKQLLSNGSDWNADARELSHGAGIRAGRDDNSAGSNAA